MSLFYAKNADKKEKELMIADGIKIHGNGWQIDKACEECAEFIDAVMKWKTKGASPQKIRKEVADVIVAMKFMQRVFGEMEVAAYISDKEDAIIHANREWKEGKRDHAIPDIFFLED